MSDHRAATIAYRGDSRSPADLLDQIDPERAVICVSRILDFYKLKSLYDLHRACKGRPVKAPVPVGDGDFPDIGKPCAVQAGSQEYLRGFQPGQIALPIAVLPKLLIEHLTSAIRDLRVILP